MTQMKGSNESLVYACSSFIYFSSEVAAANTDSGGNISNSMSIWQGTCNLPPPMITTTTTITTDAV